MCEFETNNVGEYFCESSDVRWDKDSFPKKGNKPKSTEDYK